MPGSDVEILKLWSSGNADAFAELVRRYAPLVYSAALRVLRNSADAEDIAQQCFLELAQRPPAIRSTLAGWLHRLATHRALNHLRGEKRRAEREAAFEATRAAADGEAWEPIGDAIDEAITALKPGLRDVIAHRFLLGESPEDVARALGIAERTVRHRQQQGVEAIRESLKRKGLVTGVSLAVILEANLRPSADVLPDPLILQLGKLALSGIRPVASTSPIFSSLSIKSAVGFGILASIACTLGYYSYVGKESIATFQSDDTLARTTSSHPTIDTRATRATADLTVTTPVAPGVTPAVTYLVSNSDGEPVASAALRDGIAQVLLMTTDPEGKGQLTEIPAEVVSFHLDARNMEDHLSGTLSFLREAPVQVNVKMQRTQSPTFRILTGDGTPAVGAVVLDRESHEALGQTSAEGIVKLPADRRRYTVQHPSFGTQPLHFDPVPGQVNTVSIQPAGLLRVQVLWQGSPVPGAKLNCDNYRAEMEGATTGEDGIFETGPLPGGEEFLVTASLEREGMANAFGSALTRVRADATTECIITLDIGGTLAGTLVWEDGSPCVGGKITASRANVPLHTRETSVGEDGSFSLPLFPGENRISVGGFYNGGLMQPLIVSATPDSGVIERRIVVRPGHMASNEGGEFLELPIDFAGRTAPDEIMVHVPGWPIGGEECWIPTPDDNVLRLARKAGYRMLRQVLVVDRLGGYAGLWDKLNNPGETLERLELNISVGEVRGTLTDQRGDPIPYGLIRVRAERWPDSSFQANGRGEFTLWPVPLRRKLMLELQSEDCLTTQLTRTFEEESEGINLEMLKPNARIAGSVLYEDGNPVGSARIVAQSSADPSIRTSFQMVQGKFEGALLPGTWTLMAEGDTGNSPQTSVQAPSDNVVLYLPGAAPGKLEESDDTQSRIATMSKQLGLVFKMFANETKGELYPGLSTTLGEFTPRLDQIYPEYLADSTIVAYLAGEGDTEFCYTGYMLLDEESGLAWLDAYEAIGPKALQEGGPVNVEVADGTTTISHLNQEAERELGGTEREYGVVEAEIPVLWQMPASTGDEPELLWVTFMDGHVEQREYPGEFPLTAAFIERIRVLQNGGE